MQDSLKCYISWKNLGIKLIFFVWININFPQGVTVAYVRCGHAYPKYQKSQICNVLMDKYEKNWVVKLMFCMVINMKFFYRLMLSILLVLARHVQSTQASLQCLCDLWNECSPTIESSLNMESIPSLFFIWLCCHASWFVYLLFGYPIANFEPLSRGQPH